MSKLSQLQGSGIKRASEISAWTDVNLNGTRFKRKSDIHIYTCTDSLRLMIGLKSQIDLVQIFTDVYP